ncbi:MAG: hypothetical protein BWY78_00535 [Alphaproteobacteria bacterium ADurb.Bin438]|nr:MAG: hypothetical protein BWY78_00535 [Alphaproteobacteria bacterium ADurb.Bin438]
MKLLPVFFGFFLITSVCYGKEDGFVLKIKEKYGKQLLKLEKSYNRRIEKIGKMPKLEDEMKSLLIENEAELFKLKSFQIKQEQELIIKQETKKQEIKDLIKQKIKEKSEQETEQKLRKIEQKEQELRDLKQNL